MLEKREATISPAGEPRIKERQLAAEEQMRDIVAYLYFGVRHYSRERLGAASKAVLRQIGWVIMPMVCMLSCTQPCEAVRITSAIEKNQCMSISVIITLGHNNSSSCSASLRQANLSLLIGFEMDCN